jgi:hypothetical protein
MLGSGDIGLITARRLTLEGAKVQGVAELMPFPGGLARNIQQCLKDYGIPLFLSHTVTEIVGDKRVEAVKVSQVQNGSPVPGTEKVFDVDTLILSVGLLPESELLRQMGLPLLGYTGSAAVNQLFETQLPGVFVVGNGVGIWDLVDNVASSASIAGNAAVNFKDARFEEAQIEPLGDVRVVMPQRLALHLDQPPVLWFRVKRPMGVSTVSLLRNDEVLVRRGFASLKPAEMAEFPLKKPQYELINAGDSLQLVAEES